MRSGTIICLVPRWIASAQGLSQNRGSVNVKLKAKNSKSSSFYSAIYLRLIFPKVKIKAKKYSFKDMKVKTTPGIVLALY